MAGQHLPLNVAYGIAMDGMDEKWGVDAGTLNQKLADMSTPELMILEIWIQGLWQAVTDRDQDLNEYIKVALWPITNSRRRLKLNGIKRDLYPVAADTANFPGIYHIWSVYGVCFLHH